MDENPTQEEITLEVTFGSVDPELLNLLTGGSLGGDPQTHAQPQAHSLDCYYPIKRTFWQWLRRKPRQYRRVYMPNVKFDIPHPPEGYSVSRVRND